MGEYFKYFEKHKSKIENKALKLFISQRYSGPEEKKNFVNDYIDDDNDDENLVNNVRSEESEIDVP